jgi:ribosome maturation factor RimP
MPTWPIESIRELLEPILQHIGYELYQVEQSGTSGRTLRVAIEKPEGVSLDDCQRVSELVSPLLDQAQLIPGPYTLEVSSPGAERPLRHQGDYHRYAGRKVNVRYRSGEAEGVVEGTLLAVDDAGIALRIKSADVMHLPWEDVLAGRLTVSL